jgi:hypothetical protein
VTYPGASTFPGATTFPGVPSGSAQSSDGVASAKLVSAYAGIQLWVDFSGSGSSLAGSTGLIYSITVTEQTSGNVVRGLSNAAAPGGAVAGFDHEPLFGVGLSYVAQAFDVTGALLGSSTAAAITLPSPAGFAVWMKSLSNPLLSVMVDVAAAPQWSADIAEGVIQVIGRPDPIVVQDVRQYETASAQVFTQTAAAEAALVALLASPGPYLMQFPGLGLADRYVTVGKYDHQGVASSPDPFRVWNLALRQVGRPNPAGWSVPIPGHSYADSTASAPLYSGRTGTYAQRSVS